MPRFGQSKQPDPILAKDQLQALQTYMKAWGAQLMMAFLFWILPKEAEETLDGEEMFLMPCRYNKVQEDLEGKLAQRNLLLKIRQIGGTTYFSLRRLLLPAILEPGTGSMLISQSNAYVEKHFQIIRRAYRHVAAVNPFDMQQNELSISLKENILHTVASNKRELIFDQLESRVMVESAEVTEAAQGVSLHHILADEYSRWPHNPEETLANVQGALVKTGTLDKNCTANGAQGPFYKDCMRAMFEAEKSDARFHFYPHWWSSDTKLDLTDKEAAELEADLTDEELKLLALMHKQMDCVAYV
jgi:hypothetical protein